MANMKLPDFVRLNRPEHRDKDTADRHAAVTPLADGMPEVWILADRIDGAPNRQLDVQRAAWAPLKIVEDCRKVVQRPPRVADDHRSCRFQSGDFRVGRELAAPSLRKTLLDRRDRLVIERNDPARVSIAQSSISAVCVLLGGSLRTSAIASSRSLASLKLSVAPSPPTKPGLAAHRCFVSQSGAT